MDAVPAGIDAGGLLFLPGFSSDSYFGKLFHDIMGCTPKTYRSRYLKESLYDGQ
jgi:methylphosphotriester-DNA--protein-cysteine methyltransferase